MLDLKRSALLFLSLFVLNISAVSGHDNSIAGVQKTEYFATLPFRETPFSALLGIHPISAQEAKTRKHFRFHSDEAGRPIDVAFMQGEDVVDLNDSGNYYFFAPRVHIEYGNGTETRVFFDKNDNRIAVSGDVFKEIYRLDERGYRRSLEFYDVAGDPAENSWGVARYEWTILDDGVVIEKRYGFDGNLAELRNGFPFYEIRLHFGPNGWLALMQNYGTEGRLTLNKLNAAQDRLEFFANGDNYSWNVLDENGAPSTGNGPGVARGVMERDEYGYEIVESYEDHHGAPITNAYGFSYTRSTNDEFGNRIERANYTLDGAQLMSSEGRGYAGYRAIYDSKGRNRMMFQFYDAARKPTARQGRGYFQIRYEFDDNDMETATNFEDKNGRPINREDTGIARIENDYDARGRLTETRYLDDDGNLTDNLRSGYATIVREYGDHGVPTSVARFTAAGERVE